MNLIENVDNILEKTVLKPADLNKSKKLLFKVRGDSETYVILDFYLQSYIGPVSFKEFQVEFELLQHYMDARIENDKKKVNWLIKDSKPFFDDALAAYNKRTDENRLLEDIQVIYLSHERDLNCREVIIKTVIVVDNKVYYFNIEFVNNIEKSREFTQIC